MSADLQNPYLVLGVERTADERAIKKAYVALVRKFSPEKHPEEFKKIRAAYELLSDASSRARFDEGEKGYAEYGEELSKRLEDADQATSDGNAALAREILVPLAERFPDVTVVKEKLGFLLLNAGEHERAADVFSALAVKEPENARHHLHTAFALARLERHPQVEKALREASRLDPKDVRVALALIDFFIERERTEEALDVASAIIPLLEPNSLQVAVFLLRQVEANATSGEDVTASVEVGDLRQLVRVSTEENLGAFIASQIASTAAKLFAMKQPSAANRLLVLCGDFDPSAALVWPLPSKVRVRPEDLPAAFREWLEGLSADESAPYVLRHRSSLATISLLLLAIGVFVAGAFMVAGATAAANPPSIVFACLVLFGGGTGLVMALQRLLLAYGGRIRTITTLHPLYFVHATPSLVELYPLFMLTGTHGVHQHANGVYTGTSLTFAFGDASTGGPASVSVTVAGQAVAQEFVDTVLGVRGRSLELLAEGALEAEHLVDDLPPRTLKDLPLPPSRPRAWLRPLAVGLAAAALVVTPIAVTSTSGEDVAIAKAASSPDEAQSLEAYRAYLARHPKGRHRALVEGHLRDTHDRMIAGLRVDPAHPGEAALVKAVEHVRDRGGKISIDAAVDDRAFGPAAKRETGSQIDKALRVAGLGGIVVRPDGPPDAAGGPRVIVRLRPGPSKTLRSGTSTIEVRGAVVEIAVELAGARVFERVIEVAAPDVLPSKRGAEPATAARATLSAALDAATRGLGLHAPAARLGGAL